MHFTPIVDGILNILTKFTFRKRIFSTTFYSLVFHQRLLSHPDNVVHGHIITNEYIFAFVSIYQS